MFEIMTQIQKIREINKQNKLVIFVGAGVSRNSGVCSWWDIVRDIAVKIGYNDICEKCKTKDVIESKCGNNCHLCNDESNDCYWKSNYSSEEFLKIPQYFFDTF